MKKLSLLHSLSLLLIVCPGLLLAQKNNIAFFNDYMNAQVSVNDFSGTILIAQKDKVIFEKAFGLADRELNVKSTVESKYQIGSITKQFTAAAVLLLAEEAKLNLNDKLSRYFPDFPKGDSVTIHMLLNHTSGIKDYTSIPAFFQMAPLPIAKDVMVDLIKKQPYNFLPGTKWNYSNSGYFLLGYIIEKVSGKSYNDYVYNSVIKKAGLQNTFVNRWDTILSNRAKGYEMNKNGLQNAMYISMEAPYSAGAIISTSRDLYKWNNAMFSNKIISAASFNKMTTPYLNSYGYGLVIDTFQNHLRIGHNGSIPGFSSYMGRFPADGVVIVVISNNSRNANSIANALAASVLGMTVIKPYNHAETKIEAAILDKYIGKYIIPSAGEIQIIKKEGKLYRHKTDSDVELKAESATKFFYGDGSDRQIEFKVNKSGQVVNSYFINAGIREEMLAQK